MSCIVYKLSYIIYKMHKIDPNSFAIHCSCPESLFHLFDQFVGMSVLLQLSLCARGCVDITKTNTNGKTMNIDLYYI